MTKPILEKELTTYFKGFNKGFQEGQKEAFIAGYKKGVNTLDPDPEKHARKYYKELKPMIVKVKKSEINSNGSVKLVMEV